MGRYLTQTQTTDKAEQLEEWVIDLADETNRGLAGAELYDINLSIRDSFEIGGQKYNNGFVGVRIRFNSREPVFLTECDREAWYSRMKDIGVKRWGISTIGTILSQDYDWTSIDFEEPSEEELYQLTPNKEVTIRAGFERVKKYAEWFCSAVEDYGNIVQAHNERMRQYLVDLETLSE